ARVVAQGPRRRARYLDCEQRIQLSGADRADDGPSGDAHCAGIEDGARRRAAAAATGARVHAGHCGPTETWWSFARGKCLTDCRRSQRVVDDFLCLAQDAPQMALALEALRVDPVEILGP